MAAYYADFSLDLILLLLLSTLEATTFGEVRHGNPIYVFIT